MLLLHFPLWWVSPGEPFHEDLGGLGQPLPIPLYVSQQAALGKRFGEMSAESQDLKNMGRRRSVREILRPIAHGGTEGGRQGFQIPGVQLAAQFPGKIRLCSSDGIGKPGFSKLEITI